jgi:hypothetical protein
MGGATPKPIFVIGLNRSGTKWLSNELSKHTEIACVRNENTGIRETNMFRAFGRKFDLNHLDDYIGLVELWSSTDFFIRTGVDKAIFFSSDPPITDHYLLFAQLMNAFATKQGKAYWLQKGSPIAGLELLKRFPDAHFVIVRRQMVDQIRSNVGRFARPGWTTIARATFSYVRDNQILDRLQSRSRCPSVSYEELKMNRATIIQDLLNTWEITRGEIDETVVFRPNTTFPERTQRDDYFHSGQRLWIHFCALLSKLLPFPLKFYTAKRNWQRVGPLVAGTFDNVYRQHPELKRHFT